MNRIHLIGIGSTGLSLAILLKSFLENNGIFFSTLIKVTQSNLNLLVLLVASFYYVVVAGKLIQTIWFGRLRALELEHLYERSWFAVMDTSLALTMFRDGFDLLFILRFGTLLFCKTFHWLIGDRVDFMDQALDHNYKFHLKMSSIIFLFLMLDIGMLVSAINHTLIMGPTMLIVFGFEYIILTCTMLAIIAKYILQTIDSGRATPWEDKTTYFSYVDLALDFCKLAAYSALFVVLVHYYGIPLHIVRDVYMTLRSFLEKCRKIIRSRQATANMETRYPTATQTDLDGSDRVCIVCREEMIVPVLDGPNATPRSELPKKLPCGHIFHFRCLRNWLDRQQACPTCRRSVLEAAPTATTIPQDQALQNNLNNNNNFNIQQQGGAPHAGGDLNQMIYPIVVTHLGPDHSTSHRHERLFDLQDLDQLTDEQLVEMQGSSRKAIISRLKQIQKLEGQLRMVGDQLRQIADFFPDVEPIAEAEAVEDVSGQTATSSKGKEAQ